MDLKIPASWKKVLEMTKFGVEGGQEGTNRTLKSEK